jgi:integrase
MFNVARKRLITLKGGVPTENPIASVSLERETNARDRVLNRDEFDRLMAVSPTHLKPILLTAYHTGMRRGEILRLTWDRADLKAGLIRLRPEDTKTQEGRRIPLTKELTALLKASTIYPAPDGQRVPFVFMYHGKPIRAIRKAFETACRRAEISGVVFHDLRHTFVANMRRAGVDYCRIMAITEHQTMDVFKRYHTIDHDGLSHAVTQLDTYMDTMAATAAAMSDNSLKKLTPP